MLSRVDHSAALKVAYLGVIAAPKAKARAGAVVGTIARDSPAARAGLQRGDTIQRIDTTTVDSISDVLAIVSTRSPGQSISMQVRRGRHRATLSVTLGSRTEPADEK